MNIEDEFREWKYRFDIQHPINRDARVLVVLRNRCIGHTWESEYLTTDGWRSYEAYDLLDIDACPSMSGLDMHRERDVTRRVTDEVHKALFASGVAPEAIHHAPSS